MNFVFKIIGDWYSKIDQLSDKAPALYNKQLRYLSLDNLLFVSLLSSCSTSSDWVCINEELYESLLNSQNAMFEMGILSQKVKVCKPNDELTVVIFEIVVDGYRNQLALIYFPRPDVIWKAGVLYLDVKNSHLEYYNHTCYRPKIGLDIFSNSKKVNKSTYWFYHQRSIPVYLGDVDEDTTFELVFS